MVVRCTEVWQEISNYLDGEVDPADPGMRRLSSLLLAALCVLAAVPAVGQAASLVYLDQGNDVAVARPDGSLARKVTVLHEGSVLCEGPVDQVQQDERVLEVYLGRSRDASHA